MPPSLARRDVHPVESGQSPPPPAPASRRPGRPPDRLARPPVAEGATAHGHARRRLPRDGVAGDGRLLHRLATQCPGRPVHTLQRTIRAVDLMSVERQVLAALKWTSLAKLVGQILSWGVT